MACKQVKCRCGATVTQNLAGQLLAHTTPATEDRWVPGHWKSIAGGISKYVPGEYRRDSGEPCPYATKGARP